MLDASRTTIDQTHPAGRSLGTTAETAEQAFIDALPLIDGIIGVLCRGNRLPDRDQENFRSLVWMKLIENDYKVFQQYRSRCGLRTYLLVVIRRVLLDYQSRQWGKWRPSVTATRRGAVAVRLEQLVVRDGLTVREAVSILRTNFQCLDSTATLHEIASELPRRRRIRVEGRDALPEVVDHAPLPDAIATRDANKAQAARVRQELSVAIRRLPDEDRRILKLRYVDAMPIVKIAETLGCDAKSLYRRIERILARVREEMQGQGISRDVALDAFDAGRA